ncbi:MAG: hypothetical protein ACXVZR_10445 [Terriglobales bacterium]
MRQRGLGGFDGSGDALTLRCNCRVLHYADNWSGSVAAESGRAAQLIDYFALTLVQYLVRQPVKMSEYPQQVHALAQCRAGIQRARIRGEFDDAGAKFL